MQEIVFAVIITIQVPIPPAPADAKRPEPFFTKEQPPMCRCEVRYGSGAMVRGFPGRQLTCGKILVDNGNLKV